MSENNCDVNNNQQINHDISKTQLEQVNNPQKQQNQIQQEKSPNNNGQNQLNGNNLSKEQKDNIIKNYELSIEYENSLRQEIELSTPLISEELPISILLDDYKSNNEYSTSIKQITDKYKYIRKVRRDGNCFYRSFIYRIFEYICIKNNKNLYEHIKKKISEAKELIKRNGYDWTFIEDFHNIFYMEFYHCFNSLQAKGVSVRDYLDNLFSDKEKGNYLIYFIRFCIAAFLKENSFLYEVYVDGAFENWITNEVEAIDHEADQIQIMACVNFFDIGVKIEYLHPYKNEVMKFPEDKPDDQIFITVLFTPGHYDLLYSS
jgi:hypothetical protein